MNFNMMQIYGTIAIVKSSKIERKLRNESLVTWLLQCSRIIITQANEFNYTSTIYSPKLHFHIIMIGAQTDFHL